VKQETVFNIEKVPKDEHPSNQPRIGKLTLDERLVKVRRYIEKRYRRKWLKKVSYDCRKTVADNRLRIKGRFVKNQD
jgi:hypothetical protein